MEVYTTDILDDLIVCHIGIFSILRGNLSAEDGIVGLNKSSGNLGDLVKGELQLGLLSAVNR